MATVANTPLSKLIAEMQPVKYEKLCLSCWIDQIFSYLDSCLGLSFGIIIEHNLKFICRRLASRLLISSLCS